MANAARNIEKDLDGLNSEELLLRLTWEEWLAVQPPFAEFNYSIEEATVRFHRNGYDWDMHRSLSALGLLIMRLFLAMAAVSRYVSRGFGVRATE